MQWHTHRPCTFIVLLGAIIVFHAASLVVSQIGKACEYKQDCPYGLACYQGICSCPLGKEPFNGICVYSCDDNAESRCQRSYGPHSKCVIGYECICQDGYQLNRQRSRCESSQYEVSSTTFLPRTTRPPPTTSAPSTPPTPSTTLIWTTSPNAEYCSSYSPCSRQDQICDIDNNRCTNCEFGFKRAPGENYCQRYPCNFSYECRDNLDPNSYCSSDNVCLCKDGFWTDAVRKRCTLYDSLPNTTTTIPETYNATTKSPWWWPERVPPTPSYEQNGNDASDSKKSGLSPGWIGAIVGLSVSGLVLTCVGWCYKICESAREHQCVGPRQPQPPFPITQHYNPRPAVPRLFVNPRVPPNINPIYPELVPTARATAPPLPSNNVTMNPNSNIILELREQMQRFEGNRLK